MLWGELMNELINSGIYAITEGTEVVYVGSTKNSFAHRWGCHVNDAQQNKHCNPELSKLICSGEFDFLILESTNAVGDELFEKERYYINLYKPKHCINVGGGKVKDDDYSTNVKLYIPHDNIIAMREYILDNWYNVKITPLDKETITLMLIQCGIQYNKFKYAIRQLGFTIHAFADKKSYIITDTTY